VTTWRRPDRRPPPKAKRWPMTFLGTNSLLFQRRRRKEVRICWTLTGGQMYLKKLVF
jgi:hypothetical protein